MKRIHPVKIDNAVFYERVWAEQFNTRAYYDAVRQRALARDVRDGYKVLDVGAGVFGTCQYIAEHTQIQADLWAIDQSYTARDIVAKVAPQIHFVLAEFDNGLPFETKEFDIVTAGEIIEHMEDPAAFVKELCRVGRRVALSTVNPDCENAQKCSYPEHLWEFTPDDLVGFFSPCGVAEYSMVGDYHFIRWREK